MSDRWLIGQSWNEVKLHFNGPNVFTQQMDQISDLFEHAENFPANK